MTCYQYSINEPVNEGRVELDVQWDYKLWMTPYQETLSIQLLRYQVGIHLMNEEVVRVILWFEALRKDTHEYLIRLMSITKGAPQNPTPPGGDAPKIPKSP